MPDAPRRGLTARLRLPFRLVLFLLAVFTLTATAWFTQKGLWELQDQAKYISYFFAALLASGLRIKGRSALDGGSMSFIFILIAIVELSLVETLLIGGSAILLQAIGRRLNQERAAETLASLISTVAGALAAHVVYHAPQLINAGVEAPVRLVASSFACFLAYNSPLAAASAISTWKLKPLTSALYIWSLPYYLIAAIITSFYSAMHPFVNWYTAAFLIPMVYLLYRSYRLYIRRLEEQHAHAARVQALHMRTIETLALAIEAKDQNTSDHLRRVQVYAVAIGEELGLDETQMQALRAAAVLHDIGKLAVPEHIISKPGKLTPEEFEKMKIHPVVGAEILERARFPYPVAPIVRSHHERWDGSGYPDGLKGEVIPIGARILAAVDCLDALASDRQYRRALPLDKAMEEVFKHAGKDFDPKVVEVLKRRYVELEAKAQATPIEPGAKLSTDVKVTKGHAPGRGLEMPEFAEAPLEPDFIRTIGAAREEVRALFELTQELGASLDVPETFAVLGMRLKPLVPYEALAVYGTRGDQLIPKYVHGDRGSSCLQVELTIGDGISGWVVSNSKPAVNRDPAKDGESLSDLRSAISVPLAGADGVYGALTLYSATPGRYSADHLRVLKAVAPKLSLAIENGMKFKRAEDSATTDYLTGLPNAHSLFLHLDNEIALGRCLDAPIAVLVCDLNGFKGINDTLGHLVGNKLLQAVALALKERCREYDYVARMGGDEFVMVFSGVTRASLAERAPQLRAAIRKVGADICGEGLLDASFGVAFYPDDGTTADELLANSDREMYREKARQKTGASFTRKSEKPTPDRRAPQSNERPGLVAAKR